MCIFGSDYHINLRMLSNGCLPVVTYSISDAMISILDFHKSSNLHEFKSSIAAVFSMLHDI